MVSEELYALLLNTDEKSENCRRLVIIEHLIVGCNDSHLVNRHFTFFKRNRYKKRKKQNMMKK